MVYFITVPNISQVEDETRQKDPYRRGNTIRRYSMVATQDVISFTGALLLFLSEGRGYISSGVMRYTFGLAAVASYPSILE